MEPRVIERASGRVMRYAGIEAELTCNWKYEGAVVVVFSSLNLKYFDMYFSLLVSAKVSYWGRPISKFVPVTSAAAILQNAPAFLNPVAIAAACLFA